MTARFGRNKRRRAREAIAALTERAGQLDTALMLDRKLLRDTTQKLWSLRDEVERAKELVGHYSVLFPPSEFKVAGEARSTVDIDISPSPIVPLKPPGPLGDERFVRRQPIDVLLGYVDLDRLRDVVHCTITFGDGTAGYAMSRRAVTGLPVAELLDRLHSQIAHVLARQLLDARKQR